MDLIWNDADVTMIFLIRRGNVITTLIKTIFICLFSIAALQAKADGLDINLNDDSGRLTYIFDVGDAEIPVSALNGNDEENGRYWVVSGGLGVSGDEFFGDTLMAGSLGVNAYTVDTEEFEIIALGLGGMIGFYPNNSKFGFHFGGYYSPAFVTGLDGENFWEARFRADFKMFDNARIYVGYREIRAKLEDSGEQETIDKGAHGGLELSF